MSIGRKLEEKSHCLLTSRPVAFVLDQEVFKDKNHRPRKFVPNSVIGEGGESRVLVQLV